MNKKIAICIPFYKFMDAKAVETLIAMLCDIANNGDVYIPIMGHSIDIAMIRDLMLRQAAKEVPDADYVLCIDTDHVYSGKVLYSLMGKMEAKGLEFLSAAYRARSMPDYYAHCRKNEKGEYKKIPYGNLAGLIDCDGVGFGFILMKMGLVKRMVEAEPILFQNPSEDIFFCRILQKNKVPIVFDADNKVGHLSQVVL